MINGVLNIFQRKPDNDRQIKPQQVVRLHSQPARDCFVPSFGSALVTEEAVVKGKKTFISLKKLKRNK